MKVNVNLFKPSGKWYAGGVVDVDESHYYWSQEHRQDIINKQQITHNFDGFVVVVTHRDDYDQGPSQYFCQMMYPAGKFDGMRKQS